MLNQLGRPVGSLRSTVFLSAIMFSFPTLNDLRIFDENLLARQAEWRQKFPKAESGVIPKWPLTFPTWKRWLMQNESKGDILSYQSDHGNFQSPNFGWYETTKEISKVKYGVYPKLLWKKAKISVSLLMQTTTEIYVVYPKWLWKSTSFFFRQCSLIIYWFHKYDNKWFKFSWSWLEC